MSGAAVVVEVAPADAASSYVATLVRACSEGLRSSGGCALSTEGESDPPRAVAVVSWDGVSHQAVRVEIGIRRGERSEWLVRNVSFAPSDAEVERWRSVGLVIATLVGEAIPERARVAPEQPAPEVPLPKPAAPAREESQRPEPRIRRLPLRHWSLELGFETSRGSASFVAARGVSLRAARTLGAGTWFATASAHYLVQPAASEGIDLAWLAMTAGLGALLPVPEAHLTFEARLEPMLSWVTATAAGPTGAEREAGVLLSVRQGVGATLWLATWLGVALDADLFETTRRTVVRMGASESALRPTVTVERLGWAGTFGLRLALP